MVNERNKAIGMMYLQITLYCVDLGLLNFPNTLYCKIAQLHVFSDMPDRVYP